jgi:hypothetical protein
MKRERNQQGTTVEHALARGQWSCVCFKRRKLDAVGVISEIGTIMASVTIEKKRRPTDRMTKAP